MACGTYTLNGLDNSCRDNNIGGVKEFYAVDYDYAKWTIDTDTHTIVPEFTSQIYTYKLPKNTASLQTTYNTDSDTYTNELTVNFYKWDTAKRLEFMALMDTPLAIIVKDNHNKYWYLGKDEAVLVSNGSANSGTQRTDRQEYSITFTDLTLELPYEVTADVMEDILTDWSEQYLQFKVTKGSVNIGFYKQPDKLQHATIEYSYDLQDWTEIDFDEEELQYPIYINADSPETSIVYFRGTNPYGTNIFEQEYEDLNDGFNYSDASSDIELSVKGNVMSLVYGDDFIGKTTIPSGTGKACFAELFGTDSDEFKRSDIYCPITDASKLVIPMTSIPELGCNYLFTEARQLKYAPELPATTVGKRAYDSMFMNCESLIKAPSILPAMTIGQSCYEAMFSGCELLTTAPELPATALTTSCYERLFEECYSLAKIKCLAVSNINSTNLSYWVADVPETGIFIKNPLASWTTGASAAPTGWLVIDAE